MHHQAVIASLLMAGEQVILVRWATVLAALVEQEIVGATKLARVPTVDFGSREPPEANARSPPLCGGHSSFTPGRPGYYRPGRPFLTGQSNAQVVSDFSYATMFLMQVLLVSGGNLSQEKDGAYMLMVLVLAPFTVPLVVLIGLGWVILQLIFALGGLF